MPDDLLKVTMSPAAAERFTKALSYADAVLSQMADANEAPKTADAIRDHASYLRWGVSRVALASRDSRLPEEGTDG